MNVLTIDIEEWFHLLNYDATRTPDKWGKYEVRIHRNVDRILDLLERTDTKATFFIVGWVAKTYPDVVKKIAARYQVGSHTMNHLLLWQQTPEAFNKDVESSVKLLQDITGQPIECFRAPGFSLRETESWAFYTLAELGIKYDSSVYPAPHAYGGMASYGAPVPAIIRHGDTEIKEFPVTTKTIAGKTITFSGGASFRFYPYPLIKRWSDKASDYLMSYIHPHDLDVGQPMMEDLPLRRKIKVRWGTRGAADKMLRYLNDFRFTDLRTAAANICWEQASVVTV